MSEERKPFYVCVKDLSNDKRSFPKKSITLPIMEQMALLKNINRSYGEEIAKNNKEYNELKEKLFSEYNIKCINQKIKTDKP